MFIIHLIRSLLSLYALLLLVHFALPYITSTQQPWMAVLARICAPGVRMGNIALSKLVPDRKFKMDLGPLAAVLLCLIARIILGWFA